MKHVSNGKRSAELLPRHAGSAWVIGQHTNPQCQRGPRWRFGFVWFLAVGFVGLGGCSKGEPIVAGGKPAAYWVKALQDPDAALRRKAAAKLGNIGSADDAALPALLKALTDSDPAVRKEVITSLVKFGTAAKEAIPTLSRMKDGDQDPQVRSYARKALEKIRP